VVTVLIPNVGDKLGGGASGNREALFDAGEVKGAEKAAVPEARHTGCPQTLERQSEKKRLRRTAVEFLGVQITGS
jgi:hypothetical protein